MPKSRPADARQPATVGSLGLGALDNEAASNLSCDEVFEAIRTKPRSLLSLLKRLHRKKPAYFTNYVLLPNSQSLHGSSFSHPRAVVTGGNAHTIISFNGDPAQDAYERLEMACFRDVSSRFDFFEVTFPREAKIELADLTPRERAMPVVVSPVNGSPAQDCRRCHQSPLRPNWDTYQLWPSAYGANDDELFRKDPRTHRDSLLALDRAERAAYATFRRTGRYAVLGDNASDTPNTALGTKLTIANGRRIVAELKRLGQPFERIKLDFARALWCPVSGVEKRQFPNGRGTIGIFVLTKPVTAPVMAMISESGRYERERSARLKQYFGINVENSFREEGAADVINEHYARLGFAPDEGIDIQIAGGFSELRTIIKLARMNELLGPLGIDVRNWSMILNGGYLFEDGQGGSRGETLALSLDEPMLEAFFPRDARLRDLLIQRRNPAETYDEAVRTKRDEAICRYLRGL